MIEAKDFRQTLSRGLRGLVAVSLAAAARAEAQPAGVVRYVAPTGDNNPDCSINMPCGDPGYAESVSSPGDTIRIAGGTYDLPTVDGENVAILHIDTPNLTVEGGYNPSNLSLPPDPSVHLVIFHGQDNFQPLQVAGVTGVKISGIEVSHGTGSFGGGISISDSEVSLSRVAVKNNHAGEGAGIHVSGGSLTADRVLVEDNIGFEGAALVADNQAQVTLSNVNILRNGTLDSGGPAVVLKNSSVLTQTESTSGNNVHRDESVWPPAIAPGTVIQLREGSRVFLRNNLVVNQQVFVSHDSTSSGRSDGLFLDRVYQENAGLGDYQTANITVGQSYMLPDGHIPLNSPVVDTGVTTNTGHDIDGQNRPMGNAPEPGSDEVPAPVISPTPTLTPVPSQTVTVPTPTPPAGETPPPPVHEYKLHLPLVIRRP